MGKLRYFRLREALSTDLWDALEAASGIKEDTSDPLHCLLAFLTRELALFVELRRLDPNQPTALFRDYLDDLQELLCGALHNKPGSFFRLTLPRGKPPGQLLPLQIATCLAAERKLKDARVPNAHTKINKLAARLQPLGTSNPLKCVLEKREHHLADEQVRSHYEFLLELPLREITEIATMFEPGSPYYLGGVSGLIDEALTNFSSAPLSPDGTRLFTRYAKQLVGDLARASELKKRALEHDDNYLSSPLRMQSHFTASLAILRYVRARHGDWPAELFRDLGDDLDELARALWMLKEGPLFAAPKPSNRPPHPLHDTAVAACAAAYLSLRAWWMWPGEDGDEFGEPRNLSLAQASKLAAAEVADRAHSIAFALEKPPTPEAIIGMHRRLKCRSRSSKIQDHHEAILTTAASAHDGAGAGLHRRTLRPNLQIFPWRSCLQPARRHRPCRAWSFDHVRQALGALLAIGPRSRPFKSLLTTIRLETSHAVPEMLMGLHTEQTLLNRKQVVEATGLSRAS